MYQFSQSSTQTPQNQSLTRASVDQSIFLQMIRDRNKSMPSLQANVNSYKQHQKIQNESNVDTPLKLSRQNSYSEIVQSAEEYILQQRKQKEDYEQFLKERQFISKMKSCADIYKIVEMNYLEQHSLKAHQLMQDSMDDMNLIRKFSEQTYNKKKQESFLDKQKKEYIEKIKKKQKLQQFEKLKQEGKINSEEVNLDNSFELNNHLKKLAFQKEVYDDLNDPTGSKANNYNFGGTKQRRKVGMQLNQILDTIRFNTGSHHHSVDKTNEFASRESSVGVNDTEFADNIPSQRNHSILSVENKQQVPNQKMVQQKTLDVLTQLQKNYIKSLEQPTQKQLEINQLRNKFQKNAQLKVFKQFKQNQNSQVTQQSDAQFEKDIEMEKITRQKSIESFMPRGYHRKSNTEYFHNLFFGYTKNRNKDSKHENNNSQQTLSQTSNYFNQTSYNLSISQKPYQHINKTKQCEFSQFNSVWDGSKKQLQFHRVLKYNN